MVMFNHVGIKVQAVLKAKGGHTMYYKNIVAFH